MFNGFQINSMHPKGRAQSYEAPVPGCLGRVVNLFDFNSGITRNKLLTDKPHISPLSRSRSDISRMTSPSGEEIEDKMVMSVMRSSSAKKSQGASVKKVISQEMSNSSQSRNTSPNVVAKLMGLDALPQEMRSSKCCTRNSYSEIPVGYWQQEDNFIHREINCGNHHHKDQCNYKDIYEIQQPSPQMSSPRSDYTHDEKMDLVRQKFMEAKRLSTNQKLRQTKEFQYALEVLSSNQELFLKVLQEPNSLISGHFFEQQQIPPPSETKRITVLKPSKIVSEKQLREQTNGKDNNRYRFDPSVATWKDEECPSQPTRIVVLKPSNGRIQDVKTLSSPVNLRKAEEPRDDETRDAREVAKEITQKMRENLASHRRDETLLSDGYTCDESSFNNSEAELMVGDHCDSEVISPASKHSWDFVNQYGSPYSCSSFSHGSYSPESSVCREAKKRLSERWAMVASNGTGGEHGHVFRSSSTLGEMLALSDGKRPEIFEVEDPKRDHDESTTSMSCESPQSFTRSKSLPVSSTAAAQRLTLDQDSCKTDGRKDALIQMAKSSLRGKFTSLLFSRIMKLSKKKIANSPAHDKGQLDSVGGLMSPAPFNHSSKSSISDEVLCPNKSRQGTSSKQGSLSISNPTTALKSQNNQNQASSITILEPTLEDEGMIIKDWSSSIVPNELGKCSFYNLIEKSPPIGSIPRTLSWEEPCVDAATTNPRKSIIQSLKGGAEEEEEWLFLVQSLLSVPSLENVSELCWYSPESPLDPQLRDKYVNLNATEQSQDPKRRHLRSTHRLVFDCVNEALLDMTSTGSNASPKRALLEDRVWVWIKEWLHASSWEGEATWVSLEEDGADRSYLAAERAVMKELVGKGWFDETRMEVDSMVKEIEGKLLEDMIEESVLMNSHKGVKKESE